MKPLAASALLVLVWAMPALAAEHASTDAEVRQQDVASPLTRAAILPAPGHTATSLEWRAAAEAEGASVMEPRAAFGVSSHVAFEVGGIGPFVRPDVDAAQRTTLQARVQVLGDNPTGFRLVASGGMRHDGLGEGNEILVQIAASREIGRLLVATNASVGQGLGRRGDVDGEWSGSATLGLIGSLRAGVTGRIRTELVDDLKTDEDVGRPLETDVGTLVGMRLGSTVQLQGVAGWHSPRGMAAPGPLMLLSTQFEF